MASPKKAVNSPSPWKNPRELRTTRGLTKPKRKLPLTFSKTKSPLKKLQAQRSAKLPVSFSQPALDSFAVDSDGSNKRPNPFRRSPRKKLQAVGQRSALKRHRTEVDSLAEHQHDSLGAYYHAEDGANSSGQLWSALEQQDDDRCSSQHSSFSSVSCENKPPTDFSCLLQEQQKQQPHQKVNIGALSNCSSSSLASRFRKSLSVDLTASADSNDSTLPTGVYSNNGPTLPTDYRLAHQLKIVSSTPFALFESALQSNGRSVILTEDSSLLVDTFRLLQYRTAANDDLNSGAASLLSSCVCYQYPSLAWKTTFPRIIGSASAVASSKVPFGKRKSSHLTLVDPPSLTSMGDVASGSLRVEWRSAFESVYHLVRHAACPYFYLCAPTFTVLVHTNGDNLTEGRRSQTSTTIRAVITPTTSGLRQRLREEGITLLCPSRSAGGSRRSSAESAGGPLPDFTTQSQPTGGNFALDFEDDDYCDSDKLSSLPTGSVDAGDTMDANDDDNEGETEHDTSAEDLKWMSEKFSPAAVKKLHRRSSDRSAVSSVTESVVDPSRSAVSIEGRTDVQALFNLLYNSTSIGWAATGAQAGLPPTLIAPRPFLGAAIKIPKVCYYHRPIRDAQTNVSATEFVVDISAGPILPDSVTKICETLLNNNKKSGSQCEFRATASGRRYYPGFNEIAEIPNFVADINEWCVDAGVYKW